MQESIYYYNNGQFNMKFDQNHFQSLTIEQKRDCVRTMTHILRDGSAPRRVFNYDNRYNHIPQDLVNKVDGLPTHEETLQATNEQLTVWFIEYKETMYKVIKDANAAADTHYKALGRKAFNALKECEMTGELYLNIGQLKGFVSAYGSWNEFTPNVINPILEELHTAAPRKVHGEMNCNNGTIDHKWSIHNDYIFLSYSYVTGEMIQKVEDFYNKVWSVKQHSIKADSCCIIKNELPNNAFEFIMLFWWD